MIQEELITGRACKLQMTSKPPRSAILIYEQMPPHDETASVYLDWIGLQRTVS